MAGKDHKSIACDKCGERIDHIPHFCPFCGEEIYDRMDPRIRDRLDRLLFEVDQPSPWPSYLFAIAFFLIPYSSSIYPDGSAGVTCCIGFVVPILYLAPLTYFFRTRFSWHLPLHLLVFEAAAIFGLYLARNTPGPMDAAGPTYLTVIFAMVVFGAGMLFLTNPRRRRPKLRRGSDG